MSLKKNKVLDKALLLEDTAIQNPARYRAKTLPAAGALLKDEDAEEKQLGMF
jgi:DNA gyrase subunit A